MNVTGTKLGNFRIPACNLFRETVIGGQLCYEADLNQFKKNTNWEDSLHGGFVLIIDTNEEYDVKQLLRKTEEKEKEEKINIFKKIKPSEKTFHLTLKTISKFSINIE